MTAKHAATDPGASRQHHLDQAEETIRQRLGLDTLETRGRDALDFHDVSVASLRDAARIAFDAGYAAAGGKPATQPTEPGEMLGTLRLTRTSPRHSAGGRWVTGSLAGHSFEALVFPEHAECESYELGRSRISKMFIREIATRATVANFDRGWDVNPTTDAARRIVDLLAACLAEMVFGK